MSKRETWERIAADAKRVNDAQYANYAMADAMSRYALVVPDMARRLLRLAEILGAHFHQAPPDDWEWDAPIARDFTLTMKDVGEVRELLDVGEGEG